MSKPQVYAEPQRLRFMLVAVLLLSGCTAPKTWYQPGGVIGLNFAMGTESHPSTWQIALKSCVAERDPERLNELSTPESYRLDGWFLSSRRSDVMDCLYQKGWRTASVLYML